MAAANVMFHRIGDVAQVHGQPHLDPLRAKAEPDRVNRVVGHGECVDLEVPDDQPLACSKALDIWFDAVPLQGRFG